MSQTIPMTPWSYQDLQEELKRLIREERPRVVQDIAEARDHGDLSENAEYDAAKDRQGFIEGRIAELNDKIARAQVINPAEIDSEKVVFGATVTMVESDSGEEVTYKSGGIVQTRAQTVLSDAVELLEEVNKRGMFDVLGEGRFADVIRPQDGGKGLSGVFEKSPDYLNPVEEVLRERLGLPNRVTT